MKLPSSLCTHRAERGMALLAAVRCWAAMLTLGGAALVASPGVLAQDSNRTFTSSTSSSEVLNDSAATQRIDTYLTEIIGRVNGGATLFDHSYLFAFGSSQVDGGLAAAEAAIASFFGATPFSLAGPTLLGSNTSLFSSVVGAPEETSRMFLRLEVEATLSIGPNTILIGDLDLGGEEFAVRAGTTNININTNTVFDVFRTITTTDTYQTVARYEVVGTRERDDGGNVVPEPSGWALDALGLGLLGWQTRRRKA